MDGSTKESTESLEAQNQEEEEIVPIQITIVTPAKEELKIAVRHHSFRALLSLIYQKAMLISPMRDEELGKFDWNIATCS
jgi:hypothetical protein